MDTAHIPRTNWKQDLATYLEIDRGRSLRQIASVVLPYVGIWVVASIIEPNAWIAIGLVWSRPCSWCGCTRSSMT